MDNGKKVYDISEEAQKLTARRHVITIKAV